MPFHQLKRREFVTLLGGAAVWPLAARAEQPRGHWRVGFLAGGVRPVPVDSDPYGGFTRGMRDLGYVEGRDFIIEWRFAEGRVDVFPDLAAELVRLNVDVIVLGTPVALPAARGATRTIPIVMGDSSDPVGRGFVASLAHPGGNVTGLASSREETTSKQVELLAMAIPGLARFGFVSTPSNPSHAALLEVAHTAAGKANLSVLPVQVRAATDFADAFAALGHGHAGAVLFPGDALFFSHRQRIAELALSARLPTIFGQREYVEAGGFIGYGQSLADFYRRAAAYVDKIFKGAKPADLPIEQPTRFPLVINLKTAKALGLDVPATVLARADEVIE